MYKILGIPTGEGGKSFYRIKNPLRYLNNLDSEVEVVIKRDGEYRLKLSEVDYFDAIIMNGISKSPVQIAQVLSTRDIKVIYDIDDLDWELPVDHNLYQHYKENNIKENIKSIFNASNLVISSSDLIKSEGQKLTDTPIETIPNAIDYNHYYWNLKRKRDTVNVGWLGGSSHINDLQLIEGIGTWVLDNYNNSKFILCGWNSKVKPINMPNNYQRTLNNYNMFYSEGKNNIWVHYKNILFKHKHPHNKIKILRSKPAHLYQQMMSYLDISLIPLKNDKYRNAKSIIKLIEASGYEIPVIASNVEPYNNIIKDGVNGFLADNRKDWKNALDILINDKAKRKEMGKALKESVYPEHNINYQVQKYKNTIGNTLLNNYK